MDEATHILVPGGKKLYIGTPHAFDSIYDEQAAAGADVLKIPLFERHVRYEQGTDAQKAFPYNFGCNRAELHIFTGKGRASACWWMASTTRSTAAPCCSRHRPAPSSTFTARRPGRRASIAKMSSFAARSRARSMRGTRSAWA